MRCQDGRLKLPNTAEPVPENKPAAPSLHLQCAPYPLTHTYGARGSVPAQGLNGAPTTGGLNNDSSIL